MVLSLRNTPGKCTWLSSSQKARCKLPLDPRSSQSAKAAFGKSQEVRADYFFSPFPLSSAFSLAKSCTKVGEHNWYIGLSPI
jgi:hypothetical protein